MHSGSDHDSHEKLVQKWRWKWKQCLMTNYIYHCRTISSMSGERKKNYDLMINIETTKILDLLIMDFLFERKDVVFACSNNWAITRGWFTCRSTYVAIYDMTFNNFRFVFIFISNKSSDVNILDAESPRLQCTVFAIRSGPFGRR